ncbi:APC family permease [Halalkalibacter sp. APA_J-10(15)]|uniref:APC family permease n=1 Tax=Halalkalibacter sp. APA_J-10(15) TaxID=2933805 RepID=UPI001FF33B61|nr:amino acid permease [Halalkalibacter sp. APA_J-10(15)]MCK0473000.1 amino acid permease [Halalkalibacter sp. APA_J-10(15)]
MEKRSIGLYEGIALYIAAILGSGVLFISSVTASIAGPASILSWIIVILANLPLAYTFACLASKYPDAGGAATFVRRSFGFHFGNIVGWFYFFTAVVGQTIVSLTGAFYVSQAFGFSDFTRSLLAFTILVIAGIANYNGVKMSGRVALVLSGCLLLLLTLTVIVSIPSIDLENFTPFVTSGWYSIGIAITAIFWAFFGWEAICNLSNHFKNPDKNIVNSTIISVIIIGVLFLSLSFVTIGTGTYGSKESDLSPIGAIMGETLGIGAQIVTALLAFFICVGTSNAFVASLTQLGYSLSRDGAFPKQFSHIHPIKRIPRRMVVIVIGFAGTGVIITEFFTMTFNDILFIPTSLGVFVYIFSMAAGVKLFKNKSLPWWSSLVSLILCILVLPFFQLYIFVPVIIVGLYIVFMIFQKWFMSSNERKSSQNSIQNAP